VSIYRYDYAVNPANKPCLYWNFIHQSLIVPHSYKGRFRFEQYSESLNLFNVTIKKATYLSMPLLQNK